MKSNVLSTSKRDIERLIRDQEKEYERTKSQLSRVNIDLVIINEGLETSGYEQYKTAKIALESLVETLEEKLVDIEILLAILSDTLDRKSLGLQIA